MRKHLSTYVEQINTEYHNVIVLEISRHLFGFSADTMVIGLHLPLVDSPDTEITKGASLLEMSLLHL